MNKPEIKLLPDNLVSAAVDAGARYLEVIIDTMSGIEATGLPAELVELLKINAIKVTIGLDGHEAASTEVELRSSYTGDKTWTGMAFHNAKGECDRTAVAEALRKTIFAVIEYGHDFGWTVDDMRSAIRMLGEAP